MNIDGKKIAQEILDNLKKEIAKYKMKPGLAVLLVGENEASKIYIKMKEKACLHVGIHSIVKRLNEKTTEAELFEEIEKLNFDENIDGILVQQPLPPQIDAYKTTLAISPNKDVDGFHPLNLGKMMLGQKDGFLPCTPKGIVTLLEKSNIDPAGKHVVIVGRSNIVGKPLAVMLMQKEKMANATVTVAHSGTQNLKEITKSADILVAAIGQAKYITEDMLKPGVVVIDVGISREDKKVVGDVDFENVSPIARAITPVPGGVGPMTIAALIENTFQSFKMRKH